MAAALVLKALSVASALVAASAGQVNTALRQHHATSLAKTAQKEFKHRLRICNAYPLGTPMEVLRGRHESLTGTAPLAYKQCRDFASPLKAGDKLEFKVGEAMAGTFAVSDLPNNDAILLLVIHRHDTESTAVAFSSHVFANLLNAQVAIIDTFKGESRSHLRILDAPQGEEHGHHSRAEELRYNSVVAVNPGVYEIERTGKNGDIEEKAELVALNRQSYVVLRTGVEADDGPSYPEEIVVFPKSNPEALLPPHPLARSGAERRSVGVAAAAAAAVALLLGVRA